MNTINQDTAAEHPATTPARAVQPLPVVLPGSSPTWLLLASTRQLERSERIYSVIGICVPVVFLASILVGFFGYISVF